MAQQQTTSGLSVDMAAIVRRQKLQDLLFHRVTWFFSMLVLLALAGILVSLLINAWLAFQKFGVSFIYVS